jgi:hypothetical protein
VGTLSSGQEFIIRIDHRSLSYLNDQTLQSELQRKVMTKLMGLQFKVVYRKGKENLVADALSRMPTVMSMQICLEVKPQWVQEVINSYATDSQTQELLAQLAISSPNEHGYSLHQGIIRFGSQIWVGDNSTLMTKIISTFHSSALGGHSGAHATYIRVKMLFHWRGLKSDVENLIK